MIWKPNPKTSPTVNPLATQNGKNRGSFELRMGPIPLVVLLGVVAGCMVCSFYLGLISGQKAGFESAQLMNGYSVPKLPVSDDVQMVDSSLNEVGDDEVASDVYAKLSNPTSLRDAHEPGRELPTLGSIKDIKAAPVLDADIGGLAPSVETQSAGNSIDRILGGGEQKGSIAAVKTPSATLGSLKSEEVEAATEETVGDIVKSQPLAPLKNTSPRNVPPKEEIIVKKDTAKSIVTDLAKAKAPTEKAIDDRSKNASPKVLAMNTATAETTTERAPASRVADSNSLVRSVLPSGWFAQVAAPRSLKDAEALAGKLKASGFPVVVEQASVRGQDYFRVIVGPEVNRNQAQILVNQLKGESYIRGEPFLRLVR